MRPLAGGPVGDLDNSLVVDEKLVELVVDNLIAELVDDAEGVGTEEVAVLVCCAAFSAI
jgi:hypothetical protein